MSTQAAAVPATTVTTTNDVAAKTTEATARLAAVMQPLFANVVREVKELITAESLKTDLASRKLDGILHTKINEINVQLQQLYGEITDIKASIDDIKDSLNCNTSKSVSNVNAPGVLYKDPGPDSDMFKKGEDDELTFD